MIDHINIPVSDLTRARTFYDAVLMPLGKQQIAEDGLAIGYGTSHWQFGIIADGQIIQPLHVAFSALSREQVETFHAAALEAGATCNGPPGLRPEYGITYFAAYVIDQDGHNIEAVCRA